MQSCFFSEPTSYAEATQHPHWVVAMTTELNALASNSIWSLFDLPKGKKATGRKWVFKTKLKSDSTFEWYKARLLLASTKIWC